MHTHKTYTKHTLTHTHTRVHAHAHAHRDFLQGHGIKHVHGAGFVRVLLLVCVQIHAMEYFIDRIFVNIHIFFFLQLLYKVSINGTFAGLQGLYQ